jgi:predicted amidohydrolase
MQRIGLFAGLLLLCLAAHACGAEELVTNPDFTAGEPAAPLAWQIWTSAVDSTRCTIERGEEGLVVKSPGRPYAVGGVWQEVRSIQGGHAYAVRAIAKTAHVAAAYRSVLVRLTWLQDDKALHPAGMYVRGTAAPDGTMQFQDVLVAPPEANRAKVTLECKWLGDGTVCWTQASLQPTTQLPARKVKIGTVYLRPRNSTPEKNLALFCHQIDAAGKLQLDIVCLPEAITLVGTSKTGVQTAEQIPGPASRVLGDAAKRNRIWVVAGVYEKDADVVYNTAVLFNREGEIAGKYRKTHLPREEWQQGVVPGSEYPVFETEFGKVAIQICYDWFFPEVDTLFGLKGAEIVFAPTWGTTFADQEGRVEGETVFRVRARDNGIYLVPSVYDGQSMVIDPLGRILVANGGKEGVFWCEVDLNARESLWWVGNWRDIGPRDRMPETYGSLREGPVPPR